MARPVASLTPPVKPPGTFGPAVAARSPLRPGAGDLELPEDCQVAQRPLCMEASPRSASPGSTSAGSSASPPQDFVVQQYPVPILVRNTFIDTPVGRLESLEGFFQERVVRSCPTSAVEQDTEQQATGLTPQVLFHWPPPKGVELDAATTGTDSTPTAACQATPGLPLPQPPRGAAPVLLESATPPPPAVEPQHVSSPHGSLRWGDLEEVVTPDGARGLHLGGTAQEACLGAAQLPSEGSRGHGSGQCKPCAFFHTKGCISGESCTFCHLCDATEKKRRAKDKKEERRDRKAWGYNFKADFSPPVTPGLVIRF